MQTINVRDKESSTISKTPAVQGTFSLFFCNIPNSFQIEVKFKFILNTFFTSVHCLKSENIHLPENVVIIIT